MKKVRIIVVVQGGLVQQVHSNCDVDYDVLDRDLVRDGCPDESELEQIELLSKEIETLPY